MPPPFRRLKPGDAQISARNENAKAAAIEALLASSFPDALFAGSQGFHARPRPAPPQARRMVVVDAAPVEVDAEDPPTSDPDIILARRWDTPEIENERIPVFVLGGDYPVGDEFIALRIRDGTDKVYFN